MLKNWIKIFSYHIKNNKLFTALNVLGLAIGIAGLIFALLYWNDEQSYNAWNPEKENVYQVLTDLGEGNVWANNVAPIGPLLKSASAEVESYCYLNPWYGEGLFAFNGKKELIKKVLSAQANFFSFFPFKFIKGDAQSALKDDTSLAVSDVTALRLFGTLDAIGKKVQRDDKTFVVRGVYKIQGKSSLAPELMLNSIDATIKSNHGETNWGDVNYGLLLKLKKNSNPDLVRNQLNRLYFENTAVKDAKAEGISTGEYIKKYGEVKGIIEPLTTARLHSKVYGYAEGKGNYLFLVIMLGLSVLILILSIVNYVNLSTADAIKRAKEVGVRKIVGASKTNIIMQFIFETILTMLFSILFSLVIVELVLPYYNQFLGKELVIYGSQFYIQLIVIFIVTIIVAGIFPAIYVSNFEVLKVLKGNFGRSKSGVWLRNGMLILQFAVATFFIVGSYIVYQQVQFLSAKDLGFKGDQILDVTFKTPKPNTNAKFPGREIFQKYLTIKQELSKIPGVAQVSNGAFKFGYSSGSSSSFSYHETEIQGANMAVDFGMLEMMKIKLAEGRFFQEKYASDTISSVMVNQTALDMMKEKKLTGKVIDWNDKKLKVIGVVKDFHLYGPQSKIPPMVFFHFKTVDWMSMNIQSVFVKIKAGHTEETIAAIEKFWLKDVNSDYPFSYDFVDKEYARSYGEYVKQKNLFSVLNIIVILIALFGLFALASYSIERRMKEIAIRKTLGAETKLLLKELSKQYIGFCGIGFVLALLPAYYALEKWLENFAFRISISFVPFLIGFLVLMLLTLCVVLSRAHQATRVDVLKYLKYE